MACGLVAPGFSPALPKPVAPLQPGRLVFFAALVETGGAALDRDPAELL